MNIGLGVIALPVFILYSVDVCMRVDVTYPNLFSCFTGCRLWSSHLLGSLLHRQRKLCWLLVTTSTSKCMLALVEKYRRGYQEARVWSACCLRNSRQSLWYDQEKDPANKSHQASSSGWFTLLFSCPPPCHLLKVHQANSFHHAGWSWWDVEQRL